MVTAWLLTLPAAATVGAITYFIVHTIGGLTGAAAGFATLIILSALIYRRSRRAPIDHTNVNHEWQGTLTAGTDTAIPTPPATSPPPQPTHTTVR
jgi:PiT family inorganic phosphate transporter